MGTDKDDKENGAVAGKTFVVRDRRRFDSSGHERDESIQRDQGAQGIVSSEPRADASAARAVTSTQTPGRSAPSTPPPSRQVEGYESGDSDINFSSFVISLATQALMQLGEMKPPPGINVPLDRESARHTIDILGMLQHKTHSNLTEDEAKLLEEVLHNLRLSYVRAAQVPTV